ncbi:DUF3422 domain-containing protein [Paroceanicella profunda]|uniref:DUF3422 domain-containing protein n=1 Tax=Paroceanicella profunda TaxID=2579971 RepID=A0A5B8FY30_9RHOB|nr:DUF3422 domain-containing protein [Paroceanicella profunda]QDL91412.1 DUF3422 domain-containing protein [Paroceanicella profunda]
MIGLQDHPQRYALANELHARPFPELHAPCRAVYLAIKPERDAASRDRRRDLAHLIALLDRHGAPHPPPGADHYYGTIGRVSLKWERHTEFVTYTMFTDGVADPPFSGQMEEIFPRDWLAEAPGRLLTSALVRVEPVPPGIDPDTPLADAALAGHFDGWFVRESLAVSRVLDDQAVIAGDFRIDANGHTRFAVLARPGMGSRRLGRIVQRLLEIETYKSSAMLTLPVARQVASRAAEIDAELSDLVSAMARGEGDEAATLDRLLAMTAEIEALSTRSAFRFGAAEAYEAIVNQRIEVLREERLAGRQTFGEFMTRRFDPAMRTCRSAKKRMDELSLRAARAADMLRTRVDVAVAAQNRALLESMDRRAALQLRLQETVEGLSVVAISYYAVSLAGYLLAPLGHLAGVDKGTVTAIATLPVIFVVWRMVKRIRAHLGGD